jgi:hypothetical protein
VQHTYTAEAPVERERRASGDGLNRSPCGETGPQRPVAQGPKPQHRGQPGEGASEHGSVGGGPNADCGMPPITGPSTGGLGAGTVGGTSPGGAA